MEFVRHRLDGYISPFATQTAQYALHGYSSWESSFYLQDEWRLIPGVYARLGGRISAYVGEGGNFSAIDPRLSLLVELGPTARLYGSLTTVNEFLHPYRSSGAFMLVPGIFWYAPTETLRPMTSQQGTVGGELDIDDARTQVSADVYYRLINNVHEFVTDSATDMSASLGDIVKQGTGVAYGARTSVRRRVGRLTGTLSYTLSWVDTKLPGRSGPQTVPDPLDRRHEVQLALGYGLDDHWTFALICVAASLESAPSVTTVQAGNKYPEDHIGAIASLLPDLNSDRLPGFQRLEVQCGYRETIAGLPTRFSLRLLNSYGLLDTFRWTLTGQPDIRRQWIARLNAADLFPLYPTFEVSIRL
jgi:outer membrane receptor protein involved in Fe transport